MAKSRRANRKGRNQGIRCILLWIGGKSAVPRFTCFILTVKQCIYTFGGGDFLILSNDEYQALTRHGVSPEQAILTRHFTYFGPVTEGLLRQVGDEVWCKALKGASGAAELARKESPEMRFEHWGKDLGPTMQDMISGMINPDPTARITMDQVMAHPYWQEATEEDS